VLCRELTSGEFKLYKSRREVHGASSWTLKINAVQGIVMKTTAPDWQRDAGLRSCRIAIAIADEGRRHTSTVRKEHWALDLHSQVVKL
jgi:hypothetical protein